ncbi:MAG TPA: iron-sulfur cluster assembly scaffold protein [Chloroflexota bacterium]|jgi:nitrogen fixation NifU-like protein|nr:iron-sulfur cluster assembly scaffold protein [Chloroflexota bacterium]
MLGEPPWLPEPYVYSPAVIDHATNPRNVGTLPDAHGVGADGEPVVGSHVRIALRLEAGRVSAVRFRAFGCSATIAAASVATELALGAEVAVARAIDAARIAAALGGLPSEKVHCARVAAGALRRALDAALARTTGASDR